MAESFEFQQLMRTEPLSTLSGVQVDEPKKNGKGRKEKRGKENILPSSSDPKDFVGSEVENDGKTKALIKKRWTGMEMV